MGEGRAIRPHGQLVEDRIGNIVGGIEPDHGGEEGPGAEGAGRERGDEVRGGGIDLYGVCGRQVGLNCVGDSDDGDLVGRGQEDEG